MFRFIKLNQNELQYWELLRSLSPTCRPGREPQLFFICLLSGSDLRKGFENYALEAISGLEPALTAELWPNAPRGSGLHFPWRRRVFYRKANNPSDEGQVSMANPSEPFIEARHPIMEVVSRIPERVQAQRSRLSGWEKWTQEFESGNGRSATVSEHLHFLENLPLQKRDTIPISSTIKIHNLELVSPECQKETIVALAKGMELLCPRAERRGRPRGSISNYADDRQGFIQDLTRFYSKEFGKRLTKNTRLNRERICVFLGMSEKTLLKLMVMWEVNWPGSPTSAPGKK